MAQKVTQEEINKILWDACDTFRGVVDAGAYKNYILTMLFIKYLSDSYVEKYEAYSEQFKGNETRIKRALENENFVLPDGCHFDDLYKQKDEKNIGEIIDIALESIENANKEKLENVFRNASFNSESNLGKTKDRNVRLRHLLDDFNNPKLNMRKSNIGDMDVIGNAYEYLIANFAAGAGKKAGEFYTPSEVSKLLAMLVKPEKGFRIYDPTCGSGSLLIRCAEQLSKKGETDFQIYGQEITGSTWALAKMNMFLHGFDRSVIENGDTIRTPLHLENDEIMKFDVVVANPPFSLDKWGEDEAKNDSYGRFNYGIPPSSYGELAFVQHMIASLNDNGRCAVVLPHGVLFRGGAEGKIREGLISDDLLEAVIGLPASLFFGTGIPASIMVFNKKKPIKRKKKVLFINSDLEYQEGKNQNKLREEDLNHIVNNYNEFKTENLYRHEEKHYSRVVEISEIKENDYNLNIRRYADTSAPPEIFDVKAILNGGIPKYEIMDGYIQDIIDGFDVSLVFDERDKEYYVFKNSIDSKEKIREVVGDIDQTIISQIEKWWDKYSTALRGIENQCTQAEKEMNSFLKELSYE